MKMTVINYKDFTPKVVDALVEGARAAVEAQGRGEVVVRPVVIGGEPLFAHYTVGNVGVAIELLTTENLIEPFNEVIVQTPDDIGYGDLEVRFNDDGSVLSFEVRLPNEYSYSLLEGWHYEIE